MDETIELSNLGDPPPEQELEDDDDYDDTPIDDDAPSNERYHTPMSDTTNLIDPRNSDRTFNVTSSIDYNRERARESFKKIFGDKVNEARKIDDLFDDVVHIPNDYRNPRFIKYLIDKHNFKAKATVYEDLSKKYNIKYKGKRVYNEDGTGRIRLAREFTIENNEFGNDAEYQEFKTDMDYLYDKWKGEDTKKRIKKAGIVGEF